MNTSAESSTPKTNIDLFFWLKHQKFLALSISILLLLGGGMFSYFYYQSYQNQEAQEELFQAVYYFEEDSLRLALEGDGLNYGFLEIIDRYRGTNASNLAHFYVGIIYLQEEKYEEARKYLSSFSTSEPIIQARAYALVGDTYMEVKDYKQASKYYRKAASHHANTQFSPEYLKKAALAYELQQDLTQAAHCYVEIIEEYSQSTLKNDAEKALLRLKTYK